MTRTTFRTSAIRNWSRRFFLTAAGSIAIAAAAGLPVHAQDAEWQKVIEAGKKEGTLVLYTALVGQPSTKAIAEAFTKEYGIGVEILEARASEIRERVRVEQAAGRFAADVMFTSEGQTMLYDKEDKSVDPLPVTPNSQKINDRFKLKVPMASVMTIPYGIMVNTGLVKPEDEPKSWKDLADPKWQGKILSDDPRAIGAGYLWFFSTHDRIGEDYVRKVAAQKLSFTRDQRESQRRTARGEYSIYMPVILTDFSDLKGLPVKFIIPEEGVPYVLYGNVLLKKAPHPNAAKLYLDFLQGPVVQKIYASLGYGPVLDGMTEGLPADVKAISEAKLYGTTDTTRQNEMLAKSKDIFK
ncbi:iron(III) transport system substrate-binding protein [Xaviernesmea oryzae]|uniref:Iron(III) transport system substrate-binding protein n=1 Tax=Xaviernesmea oryzae TaxID=464029 RepID=A0A1X7GP05_9HYPH|nr:extracellular solute-binding protein [Xaviernesmea oryzae]SMF72094.1 iron(III) transport system substrate-binding protein [Xaviernesmea oryzae]